MKQISGSIQCKLNDAIQAARISGNYDALLVIATIAAPPEAQKLIREAIERDKRESAQSKARRAEDDKHRYDNFWG